MDALLWNSRVFPCQCKKMMNLATESCLHWFSVFSLKSPMVNTRFLTSSSFWQHLKRGAQYIHIDILEGFFRSTARRSRAIRAHERLVLWKMKRDSCPIDFAVEVMWGCLKSRQECLAPNSWMFGRDKRHEIRYIEWPWIAKANVCSEDSTIVWVGVFPRQQTHLDQPKPQMS